MSFILLFAQFAIQKLSGFSYIDEIVSFFMGFVLIYGLLKRKLFLTCYERYALLCLIFFYFWGCFSAAIYNFQNNLIYESISGLFSIKSFLVYFGARFYFSQKKMTKKKLNQLLGINKVFLVSMALVLLVDQFVPLFDNAAPARFFNRHSSAFIFNHSTEVACCGICSLLLGVGLNRLLGGKGKSYIEYIAAVTVVICSGRTKGVAFIVFFIALQCMIPFIRKFKLAYCFFAFPLLLVVGWNQIKFYFGNITAARWMLYYKSIFIARDFFPFGTGFGTYGTRFSQRNYSPVYHLYGLDTIYGLSPEHSSFIMDTMWPAILGETGLIGMIAVVAIIMFLFKAISSNIRDKRDSVIMQGLLIYVLVESTADSIFMSPRGCLVFYILAFLFTGCENRKHEN